MIERILRWFGVATLNLDAVARALADGILNDYETLLDELDPFNTVQLLRTRYMRLVTKYGLPADVCNDVADRAWKMIAQAREVSPDAIPGFSFYD